MNKKNNTPLILMVLDGVACNPNPESNAVKSANTPVLDSLVKNYPYTQLITYGERVGLPESQMGNSEVGHLHIGAGRIVEQDLTRINKTSSQNSFNELKPFSDMAQSLKSRPDSCLHLIGLSSKGGVHSELTHLMSLISTAAKSEIPHVSIHCITDGRDRPQKAAKEELSLLESHIEKISTDYPKTNINIADVIGRYYAMDRDKRWERTEKAYNLFTKGDGKKAKSLSEILENSYQNNITDEFIEPHHIEHNPDSRTLVKDGDSILFFNFRADRMKQIVSSFLNDFNEFKKDEDIKLNSVITLSEYDSSFPCEVLFPTLEIKNHLGEYLSEKGYSQLRIAETEKYPHVTYFFNGGSEAVLDMEERIMVPSPRDVPTYDHKPEMSAIELTDKLIERLSKEPVPDIIILNYANCDMVGHTGNFDATVKAVETVDSCLSRVLDKIKELNGTALVTADHGNADQMIDYKTGEQHTYHTTHPVPFIFFKQFDSNRYELRQDGDLTDIAPTIIKILGLEKPAEMTGEALF